MQLINYLLGPDPSDASLKPVLQFLSSFTVKELRESPIKCLYEESRVR